MYMSLFFHVYFMLFMLSFYFRCVVSVAVLCVIS